MFKINKLSEVFQNLQSIHRDLRTTIVGGYYLNSQDKRVIDNNFTLKNKKVLSSSGGISNYDILFYYGLFEILKPKTILILGNSYGFSALAFALMMPNTKIISIDKFRTEGIKFTKKLIKNLNNVNVIQASSPEDLIKIKNKHFKNKVDFILCDSVHINKFIETEFEILKKIISKYGVIVHRGYVLKDDLTFYNYNFFKKIRNRNNFLYFLNNKSSSGNSLIFNNVIKNHKNYINLKKYLNYFCENKNVIIKFKNLINDKKYNKFKFPDHPQL